MGSVVMPPPIQPGDRVAVLSPSWAAPAYFPEVHEAAMRRLRDDCGVVPVEYPTTRKTSTPQERAADLNAAFADPDIRAVLATIGGDDQITVLRHLDAGAMTRDPKRFLGYSDNTNLLNWLHFHGVGAVHGGSTQVHLGPVPEAEYLMSLRAALFGGDVELTCPTQTRDFGLPWDDPRVLIDVPSGGPAEPWTWLGPPAAVTGPTWGGNLEILQWTLAVGRFVRPVEEYAGSVLVLETSEELPPAEEIFRMLRNLGERGMLDVASALVFGRPPVTDHDHPLEASAAVASRAERRDAVRRILEEYRPDLPAVLDVDFGHTKPQWLLPYGGPVTVDTTTRRITAHF